MAIADPYYDATFFPTILLFFQRLFAFDYTEVFPDEMQLILLSAFSISASLLGVLLVLGKNTLLTNTLSHTMLLGVVIAYFFSNFFHIEGIGQIFLYVASFFVGFLTCVAVEYLSKKRCISTDASNGMVLAFFFALGILSISIYNKNAFVGTELLMGDIDAIEMSDVKIVFYTTVIISATIYLAYRFLSVSIFDASFAQISGFFPKRWRYLLLLLASFSSIVAFKAVGFIMTMSFFVLPSLIAKLYAHSLQQMFVYAIGTSLTVSLFSVALARHILTVYAMPVSTGALCAVILSMLYVAALLVSSWRQKIFKKHGRYGKVA